MQEQSTRAGGSEAATRRDGSAPFGGLGAARRVFLVLSVLAASAGGFWGEELPAPGVVRGDQSG